MRPTTGVRSPGRLFVRQATPERRHRQKKNPPRPQGPRRVGSRSGPINPATAPGPRFQRRNGKRSCGKSQSLMRSRAVFKSAADLTRLGRRGSRRGGCSRFGVARFGFDANRVATTICRFAVVGAVIGGARPRGSPPMMAKTPSADAATIFHFFQPLLGPIRWGSVR